MKRTGLACRNCKQPIAAIENKLPRTLIFKCPGCDLRWYADEPRSPKR